MLRTQTGLDKTPGINRTLALHDPSRLSPWEGYLTTPREFLRTTREFFGVFSRAPAGSMTSPREDHMFEKPPSSGLVMASHPQRRFAAFKQISVHGVAIEGSPSIASCLSPSTAVIVRSRGRSGSNGRMEIGVPAQGQPSRGGLPAVMCGLCDDGRGDSGWFILHAWRLSRLPSPRGQERQDAGEDRH